MAWKFGLSSGFAAALLATTSIGHAGRGGKIGVLTDMSSLYSDSGGKGSQIAAEMAVEDFGGSVLGQKIQVIGADHQNKADIGANIARDWYDNGNVDVIADVPNSAVALAVQQITRDKDKIFLISGGGTSDL